MQASLADEKLQRIRSFSDLFQTTAGVTKREMLSLLGHLNFAMRIIPQGCSFISHLLSRAHSARIIRFSWTIYWCGSLGWVPFFFPRAMVCRKMASRIRTFVLGSESSVLFELHPIVAASVLWGQAWRRKRITMFCNNEAVVAIINKKWSACPAIMSLLRRLTWQSLTLNFIVNTPRSEYGRNTQPTLPRTPVRFGNSLNSLLDSAIICMAKAIAPSTLKSYSYAWSLFN